MEDYRFSVVVRKNGNGWVSVCAELEECVAYGQSCDEALANIREAIQVRIEDRLADDEEIPQTETVNFTTLRLSPEGLLFHGARVFVQKVKHVFPVSIEQPD